MNLNTIAVLQRFQALAIDAQSLIRAHEASFYSLLIILALLALEVWIEMRRGAQEGGGKRRDKGAESEWWREVQLSEHRRLVVPPAAYVSKSVPLPAPAPAAPTSRSAALISRAKKFLSKRPYSTVKEEDYCGTMLPQNLSDDSVPVLCFVNTKSGGKSGAYILRELKDYLSDVQVVDLNRTNPMTPLKLFSTLPHYRVLVCGGDGSVRWVLNCIKQLPLDRRPPVAIMPLGTGNDLARILGWGVGVGLPALAVPHVLRQVQQASVAMLDQWSMEITSLNGKKLLKSEFFNNYFGLGVDAQIVLNFHTMREQSPDKFVGRFINQFWYGIMGWNEIWQPHCTNLKKFMTLLVDGKEVDLPDDTEGLIFSNIPSFGGGMKLWDVSNEFSDNSERVHSLDEGDAVRTNVPSSASSRRTSARLKSTIKSQEKIATSTTGAASGNAESGAKTQWKPASIQDGKLEIVAVTGSLHLAQLKLGLTSCVKVAQTPDIEIRLLRALPLQVDGEPWIQDKCAIRIRCSEKMVMLKRRCDYSSTDEVSDVLNWAERTDVISSKQKLALLSEFSRRAEIDEL